MTYRQLIDKLSRVPTNRLNDSVTVFDGNIGEFFDVGSLEAAKEEETDVLDDGHLYLTIN